VYQGIPFAFRPDTLFFYYQYTTNSSDTASLTIGLKNDTSVVLSIGAYIDTASAWTIGYFVITPWYFNSSTPDTLLLQFNSSSHVPKKGSILHLDSVYFGYSPVAGIKEISQNPISVNVFPNPATEQINFTSDKDLTGYNLNVYDISGKMVLSKVFDNSANNINTSRLSGGTYIYRISDKQQQLLNEGKFSIQK